MTESFGSDATTLLRLLAGLPLRWEGKASVLELQGADDKWREPEWWAVYFQYVCRLAFREGFRCPGDSFGGVNCDLMRSVNWDLRSKAIKSDTTYTVLNDVEATRLSIAKCGEYGVVVGLCDVGFDESRAFQRWRSALEGVPSNPEKGIENQKAVSRYQKTRAVLTELLILRFTKKDLNSLGTVRPSRNSSDLRREKYLLDLEDIDDFLVGRIEFVPLDVPTGLYQPR